MTNVQLTVEQLYNDAQTSDAQIDALLSQSLHPRPATMLYDKIGELGLDSEDLLLDIGCRDARHTSVLVQRYGCRALGLDPVTDHVRHAQETIAKANLSAQLTVQRGVIEAIAADDATFDFIWCRDVLTHVDLNRGLAECRRVLKPVTK